MLSYRLDGEKGNFKMTQGEILYFAYLFAKSKLNSEFAAQREYGAKRFKELSELLERLGMKSAQTEPLPCNVGDTLYLTSYEAADKTKIIEKVTVTAMRHYDDNHYTEAEVKYENGFTGFVDEVDFYTTYRAHFTLEEAQEAVERFNLKEKAIDKIWDYVYMNYEDGNDSFSEYDWIDDFTLSATLLSGEKIAIGYDSTTDSVQVDNLSTRR